MAVGLRDLAGPSGLGRPRRVSRVGSPVAVGAVSLGSSLTRRPRCSRRRGRSTARRARTAHVSHSGPSRKLVLTPGLSHRDLGAGVRFLLPAHLSPAAGFPEQGDSGGNDTILQTDPEDAMNPPAFSGPLHL